MDRKFAQTPGPGEIYLDHVGWFVPDIEVAAPHFETLGFPLTPFTVHANEKPNGERVLSGTANRCGMIQRGYLEVLTRMPDVESPITEQFDACLARYTGVHLIAFSVSDTEVTTARLRDCGFKPEAPVALRRPLLLDNGEQGTAAFSVIRLPNNAMAEGRVQVLSQDTPDIVWQPSFTAHANCAAMLSGILICVSNPPEAAERYERFTGKTAELRGGGYRIPLDRGEIVICASDTCSELLQDVDIPELPFIAAVSVASEDIAKTRSYLMDANIPLLLNSDNRLITNSRSGMGAQFVFHSSDQEPFPLS